MASYLASWSGEGRVEPLGAAYELSEVVLQPPVPKPGKIITTIVNTRRMLGGDDVSLGHPRLDMKAPSIVVGSGATIRAPASGIRPEVELAAVIGRRLSKASPPDALGGIAGYTVLNDVTAPLDSREDAYEAYRRDVKTGLVTKRNIRGTLFRSKNHDGFCPMGPWMVTKDEVSRTDELEMTTKFDGHLVQKGSTREYMFSPEEIASFVSGFLTLEPGDVISCGSVGWVSEELGSRDPTEYILPSKKGILEVEIEGIGSLVNPVVPE